MMIARPDKIDLPTAIWLLANLEERFNQEVIDLEGRADSEDNPEVANELDSEAVGWAECALICQIERAQIEAEVREAESAVKS